MNLNIKYGDLTQTKESVKFRKAIRDIIVNSDWKLFLRNLPNVLNNRIQLDDSFIESLQSSLSINMDNFLTSRGITLKNLYDLFELLNLDNGLLLLGKPDQVMKIKLKCPRDEIIKVASGQNIELFCQADGFPRPTYAFYNNQNEIITKNNALFIPNANPSHSGSYKCVVSQKISSGHELIENIYFKVQVVADMSQNLTVKINPIQIKSELEDSIEIKADVNEPDLKKIKFEWFKQDIKTLETKFISNNPTSTCQILKIDHLNAEDVGRYTCQVTRESTNEKIISSSNCEVSIKEISEFDLKIALLIGNADYEKDKQHYEKCILCNSDDSHNWLFSLDIYPTLERLITAYEKIGYIVLSFVDLSADDSLRCARLFRKICDRADRVSVLLHVIGHGHSYSHHDYLMPVNTRLKYHNNDHHYRGLMPEITISNLHNFLELFISDDKLEINKKFYVVVFWDLCRTHWDHQVEVEPNLDIDCLVNNTMDYIIVYGCLTGNNEYFLMEEIPELNLPKGPIVTNLLLKNLKENLTLYEIGENINKELAELREMAPFLKDLSPIKTNSILRRVNFWLKANLNKYYYSGIESEFNLNKKEINTECVYDDNKNLIAKFYFSNDSFLNSTLLNFEYDLKFIKDFKMKYMEPIICKKIKYNGMNRAVYRITNLLEMYANGSNDNIGLIVQFRNGSEKNLNLKIPIHYKDLYFKLNTTDMNEYIRTKKMVNINRDNWSVSSVDMDQNDSQFDTTSNDDS